MTYIGRYEHICFIFITYSGYVFVSVIILYIETLL